MPAADLTTLFSQASCYSCLPDKARSIVRLALLANWLPLPARLANTVAWFASYRPATVIQSGGKVSQLNDISGNGRALTITTPADGFSLAGPNAATNGLKFLSGRAVVADPFRTANFSLIQPCTFYLLARITAQSGITGNLTDGLTNVSTGIILAPASTNLNLNNVLAFNTPIPGGLNTWFVVTAVFNGANSFLQLNRTTGVSGDPAPVDPGGFTLGSRADGNRVPAMDVLEAIVRSVADDAPTRNLFQLYLAGKIGLSI